jgi:hypothetical protein
MEMDVEGNQPLSKKKIPAGSATGPTSMSIEDSKPEPGKTNTEATKELKPEGGRKQKIEPQPYRSPSNLELKCRRAPAA